jgi:hypothetical protein
VLNVKIHSRTESLNDPADWDAASEFHHPVDELEPLESTTSEYRRCALQLLHVLRGLDRFMCSGHTHQPGRRWTAVSLALGLASTSGRTETELAEEGGVCRAAISKDVIRVLKFTGLEHSPAWGLKSMGAREAYRRRRLEECERLGDIEGE